MSEVTDDHNSLNAAMDAIEPGDTRTSYAELSRSLRSIAQSLETAAGRGTLLRHAADRLAGQLQRSAPERRRCNSSRTRIDAKETPNFTVENVVAPRRVYDAKKTRVLATVAGFGNKKVDAQRHRWCSTGASIETKQVEVPENGRATVEFLSLDVPYGRNKGEVRIDTGRHAAGRRQLLFLGGAQRPAPRAVRAGTAGSRGLLLLQGGARGRRPIGLRDRSGDGGSGGQRGARQVRLRGAERSRRRARRLRKRAARVRARRRQLC